MQQRTTDSKSIFLPLDTSVDIIFGLSVIQNTSNNNNNNNLSTDSVLNQLTGRKPSDEEAERPVSPQADGNAVQPQNTLWLERGRKVLKEIME